MTLEELRTISTVKLLDEMEKVKDNRIAWNRICYEITCRMYVPFKGISFEDLLLMNGYIKEEEKEKDKNFTKRK